MLKEFQAFIKRGNVLDLAVAVILGTAFTAIVKSLVDDIIMPLLGVIFGGVDFTGLVATVNGVTISYGNFVQAVINFILVAFAVFLLVRSINKLKKPAEEKPTQPPEPTAEEKLLTEIRDLLQDK